MNKRVWSEIGLDPWDYEIALRIDQGMEPWQAKGHVIRRWMRAGDLRPLSATIRKDGLLRGPILELLGEMIESGQLTARKGRGHPQDPEAGVRDEFAADTYEEFLKEAVVGSDDLFEAVAQVCCISVESVRQAVTARRKTEK